MSDALPTSNTSIQPSAELADAKHIPESKSFTFIIEHLDPELGDWSALEYRTIARECRETKNRFTLCSVLKEFVVRAEGMGMGDVVATREERDRVEVEVDVVNKGVEELFPPEGREGGRRGRVCLLDPQAERELSPEDGDVFEGFLFGGILGTGLLPSSSHCFIFHLSIWRAQIDVRWAKTDG